MCGKGWLEPKKLGLSGKCPNEAGGQSGPLVASANFDLLSCQDSTCDNPLLPYSSEQA